jgi:hypothetical protein
MVIVSMRVSQRDARTIGQIFLGLSLASGKLLEYVPIKLAIEQFEDIFSDGVAVSPRRDNV